MILTDIFEKDVLHPPSIEVGDDILVGKFKNKKAKVTGFTKDVNNQPVLKTDKGDQKLFKPRIAKLMTEGGAVINLHAADVQKEGLYLNFTFPIEDTKAKVVVQTKINPLDHKILIIDEIHAIGVEGLDGHFIPHAKKNTDPSLKTGIRLGNGMVRQMLDFIVAEVKMSFPNIEKITGKRQTGARAKFKTTTAATAQIS